MAQNQAQVLQHKWTYRVTYRCCRPNMDKCFTKDYALKGEESDILLAVKYIIGHYGGLKAERIAEEKI